MSSTNSTSDIAITVAAIMTTIAQFVQYWSIIMIIIGVIGHTLNIIIYSRPTLWSNPCVRYLLASAITGYMIILITLPLRWLQHTYGINIFFRSVELCKFLQFILTWIRLLPCWYIALASVDRFFCSSTSVKLRRWSSIRTSTFIIIVSTIIIGATQAPTIFYTEMNAAARVCGGTASFQQFMAILTLFVWSIIPALTMLVCGLLTIKHIRKSRRRFTNQNNAKITRLRMKSVDRQLVQNILIQSVLFAVVSAIGSCGLLFNIVTDVIRRDPIAAAQLQLNACILSYIGFLTPCISFYLCTLPSELFRRELLAIFHCQKLRNRVRSIQNTFTD